MGEAKRAAQISGLCGVCALLVETKEAAARRSMHDRSRLIAINGPFSDENERDLRKGRSSTLGLGVFSSIDASRHSPNASSGRLLLTG